MSRFFDKDEPGDPKLAACMRKLKIRAPVETIVRIEHWLTAINRKTLGPDLRKRIVTLACGHLEITTNKTKASCSICHKMILDGKDYDLFRNRR